MFRTFNPDVAGTYRRKVERRSKRDTARAGEAAEAIRSLNDHISITPGPKRGEIAATLHGDLGTISKGGPETDRSRPGRPAVTVFRGAEAYNRLRKHRT